ncbi:hypothetical protein [Saccharothrix sp. NRRL B-16348]|uniref:hypothetical protein n=1 Tax=Saccharothrix sp. NRRL B-16348 TaxID=1415542 RepID=UPI000AC0BE66|nr:hypothetical protein [Saccharothrix sp. NRRL B-16348]
MGRLSPPVRATAVASAVVVVLLVAFPATPDAVPSDLPGSVLWEFRLASLAETATL